MRNYMYCIGAAAACSLLLCIGQTFSGDQIPLEDIIMKLSFSMEMICARTIFEMAFAYLAHIVFQAIFGLYIYSHFCSASVYYFSRCVDRKKWYAKELCGLLKFSCLYMVITALTPTAILFLRGHLLAGFASGVLLFYYIAIHTLWLFATTLFVNLVSIKLGSGHGFALVVSLQFMFMALLKLWETQFPLEGSKDVARNGYLLQLDPISHLVMDWHSSNIAGVEGLINRFGIDFDLNVSVALYLCIALIAAMIGGYLIGRHDIIVANIEIGG
ncbi:hypothetical protein LQZ18_18370 [Lachnospiraceae bacterium ZAX-1]